MFFPLHACLTFLVLSCFMRPWRGNLSEDGQSEREKEMGSFKTRTKGLSLQLSITVILKLGSRVKLPTELQK